MLHREWFRGYQQRFGVVLRKLREHGFKPVEEPVRAGVKKAEHELLDEELRSTHPQGHAGI